MDAYANIVHFRSLTTGQKKSSSLRCPSSICVEVLSLHSECHLYIGPWFCNLLWCYKIVLVHTRLRWAQRNFSQLMWKQPPSVKLCTHVIQHSKVQTSTTSTVNSQNTFLEWRGTFCNGHTWWLWEAMTFCLF